MKLGRRCSWLAVVKFQVPDTTVAVPRSVAPSNTFTELTPLVSLTVPDSASVLSLFTPPLQIVVVKPVFVPMVELIVSLGAVVSSVKEKAVVSGDVAGDVGLPHIDDVCPLRQLARRRGAGAPVAAAVDPGLHRRPALDAVQRQRRIVGGLVAARGAGVVGKRHARGGGPVSRVKEKAAGRELPANRWGAP